MCLIVFAWKAHPDYPLLLVANRDEFRERPTRALQAWESTPVIYAGRDEEAQGTWLGINTQGRFAAVTNLRRQEPPLADTLSRGWLVRDYLLTRSQPSDYLDHVQADAKKYRGFNLLVGDLRSLVYYSNAGQYQRLLTPGIYSLSNAELGTHWPKTEEARVAFTQKISCRNPDLESFFGFMHDQRRYAAHLLPKTGVGAELEEALSPIFINLDQYATRSTTVMAWHRSGQVQMLERSYRDAEHWDTAQIQFDLKR